MCHPTHLEDVTHMAATGSAHNLDTPPVRVGVGRDSCNTAQYCVTRRSLLRDNAARRTTGVALVERRPAAATVEFRTRAVQRRAAACTRKVSLAFLRIELVIPAKIVARSIGTAYR